MGAQAKPFDFLDFGAGSSPAPAEPAPVERESPTLAEARAEGVAEGRRLAMETIAADEAASLSRIATALEDIEAFLADARARDQAEMLGVAAIFLEEFAAGLAEKREVESAIDLLRRLTAHSDDRRPARLVIARTSRDRIAPKIEAAIKARKVEDFITIEADPSLGAGELRLEWRGGEARRTRREIADATAAIVRSLRANKEIKR
ncbi:MAG: hypothetical protein U5J99_02490 [Parvularculaceae bacterium]|nr:hypothetical protein [Parvularculaceae bacterium]